MSSSLCLDCRFPEAKDICVIHFCISHRIWLKISYVGVWIGLLVADTDTRFKMAQSQEEIYWHKNPHSLASGIAESRSLNISEPSFSLFLPFFPSLSLILWNYLACLYLVVAPAIPGFCPKNSLNRISQPGCSWHFGSDNSLRWGALLCIVGHPAASLAATF